MFEMDYATKKAGTYVGGSVGPFAVGRLCQSLCVYYMHTIHKYEKLVA